MSLYRSVRKTLEKGRKSNPEAQLIYKLLENATVLVDISGLDLESMKPKDGEEAVLPPFASAWIESRKSTHINGLLVYAIGQSETMDFIRRALSIEQQEVERGQNNLQSVPGALTQVIASDPFEWDVFGALRVIPFQQSPGGDGSLITGCATVTPFDAVGRLSRKTLGRTFFDYEFAQGTVLSSFKNTRGGLRDYSLGSAYVPVVTYSLLNCRNIMLADKDTAVAYRNKRTGRTGLTWKVLAIKLPTGRRSSTASQQLDSEPLTRAHLVRGHFKTFTPDKPLLGRATGRFWWNPQVRGNAERGAVIKDYSLRNS